MALIRVVSGFRVSENLCAGARVDSGEACFPTTVEDSNAAPPGPGLAAAPRLPSGGAPRGVFPHAHARCSAGLPQLPLCAAGTRRCPLGKIAGQRPPHAALASLLSLPPAKPAPYLALPSWGVGDIRIGI